MTPENAVRPAYPGHDAGRPRSPDPGRSSARRGKWRLTGWPASARATAAGARGSRSRLLGVAATLAVSLVMFVGAVTIVDDQHSGTPARVTVTVCHVSIDRGDKCWAKTASVDGASRFVRVANVDSHDVGKTFDAHIGERGVATADEYATPIQFVAGGLILLLVSALLVVRGVDQRSRGEQSSASGELPLPD